MRIDMADLANGSILAGAVNGRRVLTRLLERASTEPDEPEPLFLDFSGVEIATASFLRESVLNLRDVIRQRRSNLYPVMTNLDEAVRDEFKELVRSRGEVLMACTLASDGTVVDAGPIGSLEPKQKRTFELVHEHGETDAGELMEAYPDEDGITHRTAWNNRLAALASVGLVVEISQGRAKRYRPLFGRA